MDITCSSNESAQKIVPKFGVKGEGSTRIPVDNIKMYLKRDVKV
jgi:hypothetical protein